MPARHCSMYDLRNQAAMAQRTGADARLEYATFQIFPQQNRYEASICCEGNIEQLTSGLLEPLALHLPTVKSSNSDGSGDNFKLELRSAQSSPWFTKSTISSFLHIVGKAQLLENAKSILNELSLLEKARNFHLSLYSKDPVNHASDGTTDASHPDEISAASSVQKTSDATKNELLRAMDLRLAALRKELITSLNTAAGATCSSMQIDALAQFSEYFGAINLRNILSEYLAVIPKGRDNISVNNHFTAMHDSNAKAETPESGLVQDEVPVDKAAPGRTLISLAKLAQVERQSSADSEDFSESSEDDHSTERSRPLAKIASTRRSASPMRRVQIGRSGSHRATALTIKSLNYFMTREKLSSKKETTGNSSGDGRTQLVDKPDDIVRTLSVQDAINLFESKQREQKSDIQKSRSSNGCIGGPNKSVLRRWSAGMGDSSTCKRLDISLEEGAYHNSSTTEKQLAVQDKPAKMILDVCTSESDERVDSLQREEKVVVADKLIKSDVGRTEEVAVADKGTDLDEWTREKEAELDQLLTKMMEKHPTGHMLASTKECEYQEASGKNENFSDHYKDTKDDESCAVNARKSTQEAQFIMHEKLDQNMEKSISKNVIASKKQSSVLSPKLHRNSSPSPRAKKELPNPTGFRKSSPKTSCRLSVRHSWPSAPSLHSVGPSTPKVSSGTSSGHTSCRQKLQATTSPVQSSSKSKGFKRQEKGQNRLQVERERQKSRERGNVQVSTASIMAKTSKYKTPLKNESNMGLVKPGFYSKVTKKSSVVPVETKTFLRKGSGIGSSVVTTTVKPKIPQFDGISRHDRNQVADQDSDAGVGREETTHLPVENIALSENAETSVEMTGHNEHACATAHVPDQAVHISESSAGGSNVPLDIQPDKDFGILVEGDSSNASMLHVDSAGISQIAVATGDGLPATSSPRNHQSLSQMLQAESCEMEAVEWGNAENPPSFVYQKESPKGLKRLLKFGRKSKGDGNSNGLASPSLFSEGEDDTDESRRIGKKNIDVRSMKSSLQAKSSSHHLTPPDETSNDKHSSGRIANNTVTEIKSAQSNIRTSQICAPNELHRQTSVSMESMKGARSFFSLSSFRSNKTSEAKLR